MSAVTNPVGNRSLLDTDAAARFSLFCILAAVLFSFIVPAIADAATVALSLMAVLSLISGRAHYSRAPLIIACIWMAFVLLSATYATIAGLPGHHFKGLEKHLPIALGPLVAVPLSAACSRLRLTADSVLVVFFSALILGALVLLIGKGGVGFPTLGVDRSLGKINANFAALACEFSVISGAALLYHQIEAKGVTSIKAIGVVSILTLAMAFTGRLLVVLQSRTAYIATAIGLAVWIVALVFLSFLRRGEEARKLKWAIAIVLALASIFAASFPVIAPRFDNTVSQYLEVIVDVVLGLPAKIPADGSAVTDRLQMAAVALDLVRQRPLLGWGPDASRLLETFSPFPGIRSFPQFHNGYLQLLVSFGFTGAALVLALMAALVRSALYSKTAPEAPISPALSAAALSLCASLLISNITESIIFVKPAAMTCMLLAALVCMRGDKADKVFG